MKVLVCLATEVHHIHAEAICQMMADAAKIRGTGIAKRNPEYIKLKMSEGKAVIALDSTGTAVGFCYIETWEEKKYVANSGLIV
ncbi:MAG: GNAT family N-acetyltransferase, partial [Luteibaculum sp.]